MEIRHLTEKDFYDLRELLDGVFSRKYGKETRFAGLFPRLFTVPKADIMHAHLGAFEGERLIGTAALYPLDYVIGEKHIRLVANGNVAVHEDFRGRGVMSALLDAVNEACDTCADLCYLHGNPVRYGRWGYIGGGLQYKLIFEQENNGYTFMPMQTSDSAYCLSLTLRRVDHIVRREDELIDALRSGNREAIAVCDASGKLVGCLSLNRTEAFVKEFAFEGKDEVKIFKTLAAVLGKPVGVRLSCYEKDTLARCEADCTVETSEPALFRVIRPDVMREAAAAVGIDPDLMYAPYLT